MKPHESRTFTVNTTGEQVGLTSGEGVESLTPTFVTFLIRPRWWGTTQKKPLALLIAALDVLGNTPANYFYHVTIARLDPFWNREELGQFDSTSGNHASLKLWVNAYCNDTIEVRVSIPASQRKRAWHGLSWVYGPRLKFVAKCGKDGDRHTHEIG